MSVSVRLATVAASLALASAFAGAAWAQSRTDVVTLANGDRITGEVKRLECGRLEFKTDDAGALYLEWDKLARLVTTRLVEVVLGDGTRLLGSLEPAPERSLAVETQAGVALTIYNSYDSRPPNPPPTPTTWASWRRSAGRIEPVGASMSAIVSLENEDAVKQVVVRSILGLWNVVNELTRLRPSRHDRYRVTVFGSARAQPGTDAYSEVRRLAAELADMGCEIITGGGPGLMQAANEGASASPRGGRSVGIRVDLPFEQDVNAFVTEAYEHQTFFTRLHQFVLQSDAYVVVPGGIGTVLETMMIWQLLQVGHLSETPLILVGKMWPGLIEWTRKAMLSTTPPLAGAADLAIPNCVATADEAIARLRESHAAWTARSAVS